MSDDERSSSSAESSSEEEVSDQETSDVEDQVKEEEDEPKTPVVDAGPSEAELAMKRRRAAQISCSADLDEAAKDMLEANIEERAKLEDEIEEMKKKSEQRRKERQEEERRANERRAEDESRRKAEEEERRHKKEEEDLTRREARASKMAEFEKLKNPQKRNFVISGRKSDNPSEDQDDDHEEKKTREQLDAEKKAAMDQRIAPLAIEGFDSSRLIDRAKELRAIIIRLESEKYDLEKQFKEQQYDMLELAERARSINQVGKGGLKRLTEGDDKIQERFAGAPAKIVMYSQFERQKDKRSYVERYDQFTGATYLFPATRIVPTKSLSWSEDGLPSYIEMPETNGVAEDAAQPVAVE